MSSQSGKTVMEMRLATLRSRVATLGEMEKTRKQIRLSAYDAWARDPTEYTHWHFENASLRLEAFYTDLMNPVKKELKDLEKAYKEQFGPKTA